MIRTWSIAVVICLGVLVSACRGTPSDPVAPASMRNRLPTVTPIQPTSPPPTEQVLPATVRPSPPPPPTITPGVVETDDGPVTPSMARLGLAGEPYATLGDPQAPLTVVEFADFGCDYCRRFHLLTFERLKADYIDTGKVYYVYKDLPVTSQQGALAAQAAECAGVQGRYWDMHNLLFAEPEAWYGGEAAALERIRATSELTGLDTSALEVCIVQGSQLANIDSNFAEAQALQVYGTPMFFINAKLLAGAHPIEVWRDILDAELTELGGD